MADIDFKAYTTRAAELEVAIYTQKKLMDEHQTKLRNGRPKPPNKPKVSAPIPPVKPKPKAQQSSTFNVKIIVFIVIAAIGCIGLISTLPALGIFVTLGCIVAVACMSSTNNSSVADDRTAARKYEQELAKYNQAMESYKRGRQYAEQNYNYAMQEFNSIVGEYDTKSAKIVDQHENTLRTLEKTLEIHYGSNVVFPKYRNMVAMTMINEYLMSGRCYELEGPNGAYNLYEMELRQNIIIGQLSSIITNLEQIRENQYSLYQEMVKANNTVESILRSVKGVEENTRLTAYFTGVTAIIEASPKVYVGTTF